MSIKVTSALWERLPYEGAELLVMLAIGDFADDSGLAWPSVASIAAKARTSERTVQRTLGRAVADGYAQRAVEPGRSKRSSVRLITSSLPPEKGATTSPFAAVKGDTGVAKKVTSGTEKVPSGARYKEEPSVEPSGEPLAPPADAGAHAEIRAEVQRRYLAANGAACPWDGKTGRRLKALLDANPSWALDRWLACVANRFASDANHAEPPALWIPDMAKYLSGPLNQYNRRDRAAAAAAVGAPRERPKNAPETPPEAPVPRVPLPAGAVAVPKAVREGWDAVREAIRRNVSHSRYQELRGAHAVAMAGPELLVMCRRPPEECDAVGRAWAGELQAAAAPWAVRFGPWEALP